MKRTIIFCIAIIVYCSGLFGLCLLTYKNEQPIIIKVLATSAFGGKWQGTGFFIDDNLIMTAGHIVKDANCITIQYADKKMLKTEIWKDANNCDVGLIKVITPEIESKVKFTNVDIEDKITIIGSPGGYFSITSVGIISGKNIEESFFWKQQIFIVRLFDRAW